MRLMRAGWLVMVLSGVATTGFSAAPSTPQQEDASAPSDTGIAPFSGHYLAEWKGISVGTSDLQLEQDAKLGHYHYKWTISARGIFRVIYSDDVIQQSWFGVTDDHVRPDKYRAQEGSSTVSFDFDWDGGHALGSSEGK